MGIYGQDWASYQTSQPDTSGLAFAFVKITEGLGYINPKWHTQRDHAKAAGLVWGGYHYPHMANSARAEADYFLNQVNWQPGDVIILDWEGYDDANKSVSQARQLAYKEEWLRYVKAKMPHNPVGIYCNTSYWRQVDTTGYYGDFLWIATGGRKAGDPGITAPWLFHQYTDSPVDTNYCHLDSLDALRAWALSFTSPSEETDMPTAAEVAAAVMDYQIDDPRREGTQYVSVKEALWWTGANAAQANATVSAMSAAITALAAQIGKDVDTATVVAAVQAAIAAAVVHVDVNVTGNSSPTA